MAQSRYDHRLAIGAFLASHITSSRRIAFIGPARYRASELLLFSCQISMMLEGSLGRRSLIGWLSSMPFGVA
jgi:hypothetical protein